MNETETVTQAEATAQVDKLARIMFDGLHRTLFATMDDPHLNSLWETMPEYRREAYRTACCDVGLAVLSRENETAEMYVYPDGRVLVNYSEMQKDRETIARLVHKISDVVKDKEFIATANVDASRKIEKLELHIHTLERTKDRLEEQLRHSAAKVLELTNAKGTVQNQLDVALACNQDLEEKNIALENTIGRMNDILKHPIVPPHPIHEQ